LAAIFTQPDPTCLFLFGVTSKTLQYTQHPTDTGDLRDMIADLFQQVTPEMLDSTLQDLTA
jgi:hypothetical protein